MMVARGFPDGRVPVVLSAHAEELLAVDAQAILRYLSRDTSVSAVAATLLRTRRLRRHRVVVRAASVAELTEGLQALSAGTDHPLVAKSTTAEAAAGRTAFVFPGQGNQWASMGIDAYRRSPVYRARVDECAAAFAAAGQVSPLPYLTAETDPGGWSQVEIQGAQFVHAVGLAHVWRSCGVTPASTIGHSLGEVAAAYVAGRMALADAVAVVIARAKAVDRLQGDYRMAALGISAQEARQLMAAVDGWLEVSAVNSNSSVVVAGRRDAVTALVTTASDRGLFARELDVTYPGHTSALEAVHDDLSALLPRGRFADAPTQFIGSAMGQAVPAGTDYAHYWYRNLRDTVRFDRAVDAARRQGVTRFVELSAHASLLFALEDLTGGDSPLIVGSGRRDEPLIDTLSAGIAAVAITDASFGWFGMTDTDIPVLQGFPNAPMRQVHVWADPQPLAPVFGLTISSEKWSREAQFERSDANRRVAVLDLAGPDSALSTQLRAAIERHADAESAEPGEADLVLAVAPLLDHPDAEVAAQQIGRLVDEGLFDYVDAGGATCRDVCLVTVGGEHVRLAEPVALPAQAALAAMHRSIGFERPDHRFRHLDLPSWEIDDTTATAVIDAARSAVLEAAIRESDSAPAFFVRTLGEMDEARMPERTLDDGLLEDVVITGGSGAVGLHFARYLVAHGARRIVLLSRTGIDAATLAELVNVGDGVEIVAPSCDLRSAEQVSAVAREHAGKGASLLIHAAGSASFDDFENLSATAFTDTMAAKVSGFARMLDQWPLRSDARILVCSSVSGLWGGRGHAAYSAANRMLDVMAGQLRAKGQHCVALRYGLWGTDPGRGSAITERAGISAIERSGLMPMAPASAVAASLREYGTDPLIMTADTDRLRRFFDSQKVEDTGAEATSDVIAIGDARIIAEVAEVLNIDAATIDRQESLLDLGLDSLLALDLRKRLRQVTGASVALGTLLGGITSAQLIAELDTRSQKVETTRD